MKVSLEIRIVLIFVYLLLFVSPVALNAGELQSAMQEVITSENPEAPMQMTQKEMNELLGEDPYLGQTSYLQSPDGFSQRKISK
tara:strand:+ start:52 stop:303 length:252 start_codon:yes stop_codon:yes gene_type:complete